MSHTCNKWWSVANFYNVIDFNYMLNHLNRANKFKLRGSHCGSGHVHHDACFTCSVSDLESKVCIAEQKTLSFKIFLHIIKDLWTIMQDCFYHRNLCSGINKMMWFGKAVTPVKTLKAVIPLPFPPSQPPALGAGCFIWSQLMLSLMPAAFYISTLSPTILWHRMIV